MKYTRSVKYTGTVKKLTVTLMLLAGVTGQVAAMDTQVSAMDTNEVDIQLDEMISRLPKDPFIEKVKNLASETGGFNPEMIDNADPKTIVKWHKELNQLLGKKNKKAIRNFTSTNVRQYKIMIKFLKKLSRSSQLKYVTANNFLSL